jgi:hypothetical protein
VTTNSGVEDLSLTKVPCLPMLSKIKDELDHWSADTSALSGDDLGVADADLF